MNKRHHFDHKVVLRIIINWIEIGEDDMNIYLQLLLPAIGNGGLDLAFVFEGLDDVLVLPAALVRDTANSAVLFQQCYWELSFKAARH